MSDLCKSRLQEERKQWRKDHPFEFYWKPLKNADGTQDLMKWEAGIPGKTNTPWEGGLYKLTMAIPKEYPSKPPVVRFNPPIFHPNVYGDGKVCLSILNEWDSWKPSTNMKQILLGVQDLLNNPNPSSPANQTAERLFRKDKIAYENKIKQQAKKFAKN